MNKNISLALVLLAFVFCVLAIFTQLPLWVAVLTLCGAMLMQAAL